MRDENLLTPSDGHFLICNEMLFELFLVLESISLFEAERNSAHFFFFGKVQYKQILVGIVYSQWWFYTLIV